MFGALYFVFHARDVIAIGGGAAWTFSKRASFGNSSPCLECGFVGRLFSFAGSACSALLLVAASVLDVVSSLLVITPWWWTALAARELYRRLSLIESHPLPWSSIVHRLLRRHRQTSLAGFSLSFHS